VDFIIIKVTIKSALGTAPMIAQQPAIEQGAKG